MVLDPRRQAITKTAKITETTKKEEKEHKEEARATPASFQGRRPAARLAVSQKAAHEDDHQGMRVFTRRKDSDSYRSEETPDLTFAGLPGG